MTPPEPTFAALTEQRPDLGERVGRIVAANPGLANEAAAAADGSAA